MSVSNTPYHFFCFKGIPVYPFTSPNPSDAIAGDIIGKFFFFFFFSTTFFPCVTTFHYFSGACSFMEIYVVVLTVLIFIFQRAFVLTRSSSYSLVHIKQFSGILPERVMDQNKFEPLANICRRS